jgi:cytochrome c biogenesis protein CcmG/thiol:disulfide interchange protein DsbE
MNRLILWIPLTVVALLLVIFAVALLSPDTGGDDPLVDRDLPALPLEDFPGRRPDFDPSAVEGPYLLNVWASWCAPCRIEHPVLMGLAEQGVPIYGVVYKDDPGNALAFLNQLGDPFAGLAADPEGRAAIELGLTGAPETFVVDSQGVIRARWRGALDDITWRRSLDPAWREAGGSPVDADALPQLR